MTTLTEAELHAQLALLSLMTPDTHKLALELGVILPQHQQDALERMQIQGWVRLLDLAVVTEMPGKVMRVFLVEPVAYEWYTSMLPYDVKKRVDDERPPVAH